MWDTPPQYKALEVILRQFADEEMYKIMALCLVSILSSIIQTNGMSTITSYVIESIQKKDETNTWFYFQCLLGISISFIIIYFVYYYLQNAIIVKMRHWMRFKMMESVLLVNSEAFSEINFTRMMSPIGRVADQLCSILTDISGYFLPNLLFALVAGSYFVYLSPIFGLIFLVGNVVLFGYYSMIFDDLLSSNNTYEMQLLKTDASMIDILNNVDKIVYRGQVKKEVGDFHELSSENIRTGLEYYNLSLLHISLVVFFIWLIILTSLAYLIHLFYQKKMSVIGFLTSFSILMLFREKMVSLNEQIPGFIGAIGRLNASMEHFEHINENSDFLHQQNWKPIPVSFKSIRFENVTYRYNSGKIVFQDKSFRINTENHRITGILGESGSGKSTIMKLLIKMYPIEAGTIYIDEKPIDDMDPLFLRNNITYVNQNSKLFDKLVIENMMYGCSDPEKCKYLLDKIMSYPSIANLYKNLDIHTKNSGLLGENLSGGQRVVINTIGGFISSSKILILDEPTNALDPVLKKEIIQLIRDFKNYKQAIIIITHDRDLYPLFDDEIKM